MEPLISAIEDIKKINTDYQYSSVTPTLIVLASVVNPEINTIPIVKSYLGNMSFPGGCTSSRIFSRVKETYLPLVNIEINQDNLGNEEGILAKALYSFLPTDVMGMDMCIQLAINEIFNNIRTHSQAQTLKYAAQKWNNEFELIIYDDGLGFKHSLGTNDEKEALYKAVSLGISGTGDKTRGLGIRSLKTLTLHPDINGEFMAISNDSYYYISSDGTIIEENLPFSVDGSAIILRFKNLSANYEDIAEKMMTTSNE